MNDPKPSPLDDAALSWAVRTADPDFVDWDGFGAWLAEDSTHAAAYDRYAEAATFAAEQIAILPQEQRASPRKGIAKRKATWWIAGGAVAAGMAAMLALVVMPQHPQSYSVETASGETKVIALESGTSITLSGKTRVTLDHSDPRRAVLEEGEAMFVVRHDASRPFRVAAGLVELLDVGTAFDVRRDDARLRVAVSEGEVLFNPTREAVRLPRGKAIDLDLTSGRARISAVEASVVGSWRTGQLTYDGVPIAVVAGDVSRMTGKAIEVSPRVAQRVFRGSLNLGEIRQQPETLGALTGLRMRSTASGWELTD